MPDSKTTSKTSSKATNVWTDAERAAMKDSAKERKSAARRSPEDERAAGEQEVQAKIATMPEPDKTMALRVHELVTSSAPAFVPKTYYGMPAYARDGKVMCFFKAASKFNVRYATFEFQPDARIDDGQMWPVGFAVTKLTPAVEARIVELVKKAAS